MIPLILCFVLSVTLCDELPDPDPILKCCRNGEELHSNGRDCVKRAGYKTQILEEGEYVDIGDPAELKSQKLYWLPSSVLNKLPRQKLFVEYRNTDVCNSDFFVLLNTNNTDRYRMTDNYTLIVSFTYIDGNTFNAEFGNFQYCLDSLSESQSSHVFRVCLGTENNFTTIRKCCKFGQQIQLRNSVAKCEDAESNTWSAEDSVFRSYFLNTTITDIMDGSNSLCSSGEFKILQPNEAFKYINGNLALSLNEYGVQNYKCFESFFDSISENETVGFCHHSSKTVLAYYLVFRHFSVLAAIALAVGLIILGCRSDIYRTIHGKALLCHILCLFFGHVIYALWEYYLEKWDDETIVLVLNFFIMSSVLWLNIMCFNMARGLGTSLEVRKRRNRWAPFACYCAYAWGGSMLHTVLLASQPWREYDDRDIISFVYHTKTYFYPEEWRYSLNLEALFFGYGPVCTFLVINIGLLTTTILKIRKLERDTSILHRRLSVCITNKKKSLKYVRLLLTTGVVETAAEMAALALRVPPAYDAYDADGTRRMDDLIWFMRIFYTEALFGTLAAVCDLLRAASVLALSCSNDSGVFRQIRAGGRALRRAVGPCCGQHCARGEASVYTVNE
ncbi:hypothetical protein R5R35_002830 [Gryllus longicercus]|uniref:Uncharacterized protein n=1 Tax=Gryllus longicercus TaxID=2509291 RepID=A0AAN9VTW4_9ORTH